MERLNSEALQSMFDGVAQVFAEHKDELCEMDARMGDGDLGLTMSKGFGALPGLMRDVADGDDAGAMVMRAGMKMASVVPSTMGTLMASALMAAGRELKGEASFGPSEMARFVVALGEGVAKRGKCAVGDRTLLDALDPAGKAAVEAAGVEGATLADVLSAAVEGAKQGVEATRTMVPKFGKAAVFADRAEGVADQGAVAAQLLLEGMRSYAL